MTEETEDPSLRIIRTAVYAVVLPNKDPCDAQKINKEYKDIEGDVIPFSDYGFRTLDQFLMEHPKLNGMMKDGKLVFTAMPSERSANIYGLIKGQKPRKRKAEKKSKGKKIEEEAKNGNNPFNRNFIRSSYHGKPTHGQGDARRPTGSQPFNRNSQSYRSFTPGASRPPVPAPFNSNTTVRSCQKSNNSRPGPSVGSAARAPFARVSQLWGGNQAPKFTSSPASTRSSFRVNNTERSSSRQDSPQEGMRRFNTILSKCKGSATLRVFRRFYAQEFLVAFDGEELKRHFNTANLTEIINKYANDKIIVSSTPDGSEMFTDRQVLEAHAKAAIDLEEQKKNSVVIEPGNKHCSIPSLKVMFDEMTEMLVDSFPKGIPLEEVTTLYEKKVGVRVDPVAVFALQWNELIERKFNSRISIDNGKAVLTTTYIKANNLQVKTIGERKKQELVTLADLGIIFVEESSQEDEDEEDSQSDTEVNSSKTEWRVVSGYESMCSSVSSSVMCLNDTEPNEIRQTVISEEMDDLAERMRTSFDNEKQIKVEMDEESPRAGTIPQSSPSTLKRNPMTSSSGIDDSAVVKKQEKGVKEEKPKFSVKLLFKLDKLLK